MKSKTKAEIEDLKIQWSRDPCWDIQETYGFENHKDELTLYSLKMEALWDNEALSVLEKYCKRIGTTNQILAKYIRNMDKIIENLEERVRQLENQ